MTTMNSVCVFCGSSVGRRPEYADAATRLGTAIARRGCDLVYGAGHIGLMGILADAALAAGGRVVGMIPRSLVDRELAHKGLSELHVVESMHARKALMAERSRAFLALPGGYGTLDELFEILTWAQLGIHSHPIGLINVAGYFDPILAWIDGAVEGGLLREKHRAMLLTGDDPEEVLDRVLARGDIRVGDEPANRPEA